jgi:gamma-glutamyltranspeptidase/glutathione hydrolase
VALHDRHGRLPLERVLGPAHRLARDGFPVSPLLAFMLHTLPPLDGCDELDASRPDTGQRLARPELAATIAAIATGGREAFYEGAFGRALLAVGGGEYTASDLARPQARWTEPLGVRVWGHDLWTAPPPSSGYLSLAGARIAEMAGPTVDGDTPDDDAAWIHRLVESARLAGHDRPAVLHEGADGVALLDEDRLRTRAGRLDPDRALPLAASTRDADTMYLCAVDRDGVGVGLIQSNAKDFGCHVAVPGTGVLLHNRGIGFSLEPGHPAEYGPGRRPPHTLSPALITRADGSLRALLGTMGGDSQPQVVLQMAVRLLLRGEEPGEVVRAPRFVLAPAGDGSGFDTWDHPDRQVVRIEAHAPASWADGLARRGHRVEVAGFDPGGFGHAQLIEVRDDGIRAGAADPRAMVGAAVPAV